MAGSERCVRHIALVLDLRLLKLQEPVCQQIRDQLRSNWGLVCVHSYWGLSFIGWNGS